jgi:hypothetical protein
LETCSNAKAASTWVGGLFAKLDVAAEAAQMQDAGTGLELGRGMAVGRQVLEGLVPQLVERPAGPARVKVGGGGLEQVLGARVGQPGSKNANVA